DAEEYLDPLPQALLLTAIVIAFALVAFMLALAYRSWVLARQDEATDDEEDRRGARAVAADAPVRGDEAGTQRPEVRASPGSASRSEPVISPAEHFRGHDDQPPGQEVR